MTQVVIRLDDDLAMELDRLVADGGAASRSAALRDGLRLLLDTRRRAAVGAAIVAGYERVPQTEEDGLGWSDAASAAMIADEPW